MLTILTTKKEGGHKATFGGDGYAYHLDHNDGFKGVYTYVLTHIH